MKKNIYIFLVLCFAFANSVFAFGGSFSQILALVIVLLMVLSKGIEKLSFATLLFFCCCIISIITNNIPDFFKPWPRLAQYLLILLAVSPLIGGYLIDVFRFKVLECVTLALSLVALGSFGYYMMGMGWTTVGYFGLAQHPNFLGFFGMISNITLWALFFMYEERKKKIIILALLVASLIVTMLSAARICLAATIVGMLVLVYFRYKGRLGKLLKVLVLTGGIAAAAFPVYQPYLDGIMYKQNASEDAESATSSRDALWATRVEEIHRSPITGVGCFSVDTSIQDDEKHYNPYNQITGTVELGSTYLGVMSQTGILGFVFFALILLTAVYKCWSATRQTDSMVPIWLFALFGAIAIHMIVEGYATHAGSMQCVFLWLLLSCMMAPVDAMEEEEARLVEVLHIEDDDEYDDEDEEEEE